MHHLVNVAFHVANVLLLFTLLRRMTGAIWGSALVAALFAIHPLRVESVVWISERKDVLSGFFWMLSLLAYWRYVRQPSTRRFGAVLVLFMLGLLSKPMVVTLPVILLLLDIWPLHRFSVFASASFVSAGGVQLQKVSRTHVLLEKLPLVILSIAAAMMTVRAQSHAIVSVRGLPIQIRLINSVLSYVQYLKKTVWPANLAIYYPFHSQFFLSEIIAAAFLLLALTFIAVALARTFPYILTGWFWYLITLIPVIGVLQVGSQSYADRYTYIPTIGIYLIVAFALKDILRRYGALRVPVVGIVVLIVGAFSALAFNYASLWRSNDRLLRHTLEVTKDNSAIHCSIGMKLLDEGRYGEALTEFSETLKINSGILGGEKFAEAHVGMGLALLALGRAQEAEQSFRYAIKLAPRVARTHVNLGITLDKLGEWRESMREFEEAVRLEPDEPFTHSNLAIAYFRRGQFDEAAVQYREALRVYPQHLDSLKGLAWLLATDSEARRRNGKEAVGFAAEACKLTNFQDPGSLEILAAAQAENGDFQNAAATAQKALDLITGRGTQLDKALEQRLRLALELYRSGFAYHR